MGKIFLAAGLSAALLLSACGRPYKDDGRYKGFTRIQFAGQSATAFIEEGLDEIFAAARLGDKGLGFFAAPVVDAVIFASDQNAFGHGGRLYLSGASELANSGGTSTKTWVIPDATYKFALVGYDAANMGGAPKCALGVSSATSTILLNGGVKTITFTGGACNTSTEFKEAQSYSSLTIGVCTDASSLAGLSAPTQSCPTNHATVQSLKVFVFAADEFVGPNFAAFNPALPNLTSACIPVSLGLTSSSIPFLGGSQNLNMHLRAEVGLFSDGSCTTPHSMFEFRTGFSGALNTSGSDVLMTVGTGGGFTFAGQKARWIDGSPGPRLFLNAP